MDDVTNNFFATLCSQYTITPLFGKANINIYNHTVFKQEYILKQLYKTNDCVFRGSCNA